MAELLSHFTTAETLVPYSQTQSGRRRDKPDGLWVSVDGEDDWLDWCTREEYGDIASKRRFRVALADDARVLRLTTAAEIIAFDQQYTLPDHFLSHWAIDWARVAAAWQGIIIAPYQWSLRLSEISWYYGWDCASGAIWDAAAIASVEEVALVNGPSCRACGCTEDNACVVDGQPCWWAEPDLCSACAGMRPVRETETVDLVAALRASVECKRRPWPTSAPPSAVITRNIAALPLRKAFVHVLFDHAPDDWDENDIGILADELTEQAQKSFDSSADDREAEARPVRQQPFERPPSPCDHYQVDEDGNSHLLATYQGDFCLRCGARLVEDNPAPDGEVRQ